MTTGGIVIWETMTENSIIDILWRVYEQRKHRKTEKDDGGDPGGS